MARTQGVVDGVRYGGDVGPTGEPYGSPVGSYTVARAVACGAAAAVAAPPPQGAPSPAGRTLAEGELVEVESVGGAAGLCRDPKSGAPLGAVEMAALRPVRPPTSSARTALNIVRYSAY
jgi:hypothetical protein